VFLNLQNKFKIGYCIGIIVTEKEIYISHYTSHYIGVYSHEGKQLRKWGEEQLNYPFHLAIYENQLYVADELNRIQVFGLDGKFLFRWGKLGRKDGEFRGPRGIVIYNNFVYVTDSPSDRIQCFTLEGKFVTTFGDEKGFKYPICITVMRKKYFTCCRFRKLSY